MHRLFDTRMTLIGFDILELSFQNLLLPVIEFLWFVLFPVICKPSVLFSKKSLICKFFSSQCSFQFSLKFGHNISHIIVGLKYIIEEFTSYI